jgi:hypothetical protein
MANGVARNLSVHTAFQVSTNKNYPRKIGFLGKSVFGRTVLQSKCTFLKSVEKDLFFCIPYSKKKKF